MKTASILLALVLLSGCDKPAGLHLINDGARRKAPDPVPDYTVKIGDQSFGFREWQWSFDVEDVNEVISKIEASEVISRTEISLGPLGNHRVPCSATQGLVGFCCIVVMTITSLAAPGMRWRKQRAVT